MRLRYYMKIVLEYLIYCISVFIIINTFTQHMITSHLIDTETMQLCRTASRFLSAYASDRAESLSSAAGEQMQYLSQYLTADLWLVDADGRVISSTTQYTASASAGSDVNAQMEEALWEEILTAGQTPAQTDAADSSGQASFAYSQTGDFYGLLDTECLTTGTMGTFADGTAIYLFIHKPMTDITAEANTIINIYFFTTALTFLVLFIILALFTHYMYAPLYKIIQGTKAYADGSFDSPIEVRSNDEIGYLADTLNYMASTISTREEDQRKFISNVSHDFRSPLTSIKGYVTAMLDGTIPPEMQDKYLQIILSETERLQKLTDNLLDLNRYGSSALMLDLSVFDINQLIRDVIPTFEGACQQKSLRFSLQLEDDALPVSADRDKIAQVLYNLIDNAVKFSHTDSEIILRTTATSNKVQISVRDFGIGIPSECIPKIWDRFYKTDLSRGKDKRGSGLGLAIIKEIIQAHKEHINVVSTEGAGTEFLFTLPLCRKESTS